MVYLVVFYAAAGLGFNSPYNSQVNKNYWIDAIFNYNRESLNLKDPSANNDVQSIKDVKQNSISLASLASTDFSAPAPPDTNGQWRDPNAFVNPNDTLSGSGLTGFASRYDSLMHDPMAMDSTARLKYFNHTRVDRPYVRLSSPKESKFYIPLGPLREKKIEIDSTGKFVLVKEYIAGQETKILLRMPIDEYINQRIENRERKLWEDQAYQYELKSGKKDLSKFITDITNFEIPLPSVGVLSIFGEPKISLRIGGAVDIHGAWRSETTEGVTASLLGNTRNEPDFKQQVQINVNGTIGDKLNISADWNTERTFEYENQLKIKYTGYEDEIVQSVEAGNVSLQTSPLVGGSEALFGIKANFKMGPLSLTTIASQKKSEVKEVAVSGGSTSQTFELRAYDYSRNHFFVDSVYADTASSLNLFNKYYGNSPPIVDTRYNITQIEVWKSVTTYVQDKSKERQANAYIDLPARIAPNLEYPDNLRGDINPVPGRSETGRFVLLSEENGDYSLNSETGFITFKTAINDADVIAVAYRTQEGPGSADDKYYGEFLANKTQGDSSRLVLKLVKPAYLQPNYKTAWQLMLKNFYPVGGRNIKAEGFDFKIKYELEGQDPATELPTSNGAVKLLQAFGLDRINASGSPNPDDVFDFTPGLTIDKETGEIIFPTLQPFGYNLPGELDTAKYKYQDIYDTTRTAASYNKTKDKWVLTGKYSGDVSSVYQLGFNVVENSVKVTLDNRLLTQGVDYVVDYNIGQLTIRNDAALVPGANLKITYEQNDLFQLASKTLLGTRGIFDISNKTKLGFSILNLTQQTLSDKVRIGEEPLSNTIYGVDFKTGTDLPFLTKALDKIMSTKEMSSFSLSGEMAYMNPDPNTKKSSIASDQGKSIAYIDDFEGSKRTIPIGLSYTAWKDLSPPDNLPGLAELNARERMPYKGKSWWVAINPSNVTVVDVYGKDPVTGQPKKQVATGDQNVTVMDFGFDPTKPGPYNHSPNLSNPKQNWGGMQKLLSSTANNLVDENIEFIEFWMNIDRAPKNANMYIDLGRISEDVIPDGQLNTEDLNQNTAIDQGEDVGLDTLSDARERQVYNSTETDPNHDDFSPGIYPGFLTYMNINGTEGNAQSTDIGRLPDTEDLNRNGNLDKVNSYFRYEIPLDTSTQNNRFIVSKGGPGWYLYRIPLKDTLTKVGNPSFSNVESIRLFVNGIDTVGLTENYMKLRFAEFNLVGSQWQKLLPEDTTLAVSVISYEEDQNYTIPPGITRERDNTRPDQNILKNEQSLNLILNDLPPGQSRQAVRYLSRPLDVFSYSQMKLFIHGDKHTGPTSVSTEATDPPNAEVFFRFGTDTNNFYEYRQPVRPDWNEIAINFSDLTSIKQARVSDTVFAHQPVPDKPGHFYGVRGRPTLTSIKFLSVGIYNIPGAKIKNTSEFKYDVSGQVWVNELRVVGADDKPGWAYSIASQLKMADLLTLNFNMSRTDPYFHRLADRFGSRVESRNWSVSSDLNVLKLLPINLPGSNLKLNYSHTESIGKPLYLPGTDIKVSQAMEAEQQIPDSLKTPQNQRNLELESQTVNVSDSWSASNIKLRIPSTYWLIRDTWNAISLGFNYNKNFSRSPTILTNKSWIWNANIGYGLSLSQDYFFYPADIPVLGSVLSLFTDYRNAKVYFTPQSIALNMSARRNRNISTTRERDNAISQTSISRDFTVSRGFNYSWKLTEGGLINISTAYNVNISSSLAYLETDQNNMQRSESEIWHDIFAGNFFGKNSQYQQTFDIRTAPKLPSLWDIDKYFTITAGYSTSYQWNNDFRNEISGRGAGFASKSSAGLTLRLKALAAPLFEESKDADNNQGQAVPNRRNTGRNFNPEGPGIQNKSEVSREEGVLGDSTSISADSLLAVDSLQTQNLNKKSALKNAFLFLKSITKALLFDYESISFNFSSSNNLAKSGIKGTGTGFNNFWGISFDENNGPSRGFMFGLSRNVGSRAPNSTLSDNFSQKNNFDFKTSRPLWEGAKIDLNWNVGWSINKSTQIITDDFGNISVGSISSTGTISRSFFSMPPTLFLSVFKSGIKKVNELFDPNSANPHQNLSNAFVKGFESFPLLSNVGFLSQVAKYIPRPNWRLSWDGLEKFPLFKAFAKRVTLDHAYSSTYTEGWRINPDGVQEVQTQRIEYGFAPLVGLNFTFGEVWGGNLISSVKYSTRTGYDLGLSTTSINETFSRDIGITASYSKSGFELPLFGVSLKNDIEFSLSYTSTKNSTVIYDFTNFKEEGTPQDGTTRTTLEPRIKYTISSRVTLSVFYRRSSVQPEGAARIPPTTTNEAGLDVHISIQQ